MNPAVLALWKEQLAEDERELDILAAKYLLAKAEFEMLQKRRQILIDAIAEIESKETE